jgi:ribonuclease HI
LNCDGALNFQEKVAGTGVIVRDHTGGFVVAECRKYSHIVDPGMVELLACRDAVWLAKARGWSHVVVETDCQLIVKEWNEGKVQRSASTLIMREMKATISDFQGFTFCFAKREANKSAHVCAREALSINSLDVFYELIPDFLIEPVQSDLLSSIE